MKTIAYILMTILATSASVAQAIDVESYNNSIDGRKFSVHAHTLAQKTYFTCESTYRVTEALYGGNVYKYPGHIQRSDHVERDYECETKHNALGASGIGIEIVKKRVPNSTRESQPYEEELKTISGKRQECLQEQIKILGEVKQGAGNLFNGLKEIAIYFTDNTEGLATGMERSMAPSHIDHWPSYYILNVRTVYNGACDLSSTKELVRVLQNDSRSLLPSKDPNSSDLAESAKITIQELLKQ